jgi:hypothetical protein
MRVTPGLVHCIGLPALQQVCKYSRILNDIAIRTIHIEKFSGCAMQDVEECFWLF